MDYSKHKILDFYRQRLVKFKEGPQIHGWGSLDSQKIRYRVLTKVGDLDKKSVLDLGCGIGCLYDFLLAERFNVKYAGYDIVPELIEVARNRHPKAKFLVKDILTEPENSVFDYVLSSGINNVKTKDNAEVAKILIKTMFDIASIGIAINMLSNYASSHNNNSYYAQPEEMFAFSMSLTKKVVLTHNYKLNDFTLYLYKEERMNS